MRGDRERERGREGGNRQNGGSGVIHGIGEKELERTRAKELGTVEREGVEGGKRAEG